MFGRKQRVRLHLIAPERGELPSVEGLLISRGREYLVAVPELLVAPGANPAVLQDARYLAIPRERIAFYEVLA